MKNRFTKQVDEKLFIDKSYLIKELLDDGAKIKNFIMPKGFGKSMNLDMLHSFFSNRLNHGSYFKKLEISKASDYFAEHQGCYPVIYMNLSSLCANTFESAFKEFKQLVTGLYKQYEHFLLDNCTEFQKNDVRAILNGSADLVQFISAIRDLTDYLGKIHEKGVIFLLDDYDLPLNKAREHYFAYELILLLSDVFRPVFKTNEHLDSAILMGKEPFSINDVNNTTRYSLCGKSWYSEYFGFSMDEVKQKIALTALQLEVSKAHLIEKFILYYGGYYARDMQLLNPAMVMQCIANVKKNRPDKAILPINLFDDSYVQSIKNWIQFDKDKEALLMDFKKLLNNESVIKKVNLYPGFQCNKDENHANFWGCLVNQGYLDSRINNPDDYYNYDNLILKIPNLIAKRFFSMILELVMQFNIPRKQHFQHQVSNLNKFEMGFFNHGMANQDEQLYKRVLQLLENTAIDDNLMQKISVTMNEFCKINVCDRDEIRRQLIDYLITLEEKYNTNALNFT